MCERKYIFVVTSEVIQKEVQKLKLSPQPDSDGVATCILKKCNQQLFEPLAYLSVYFPYIMDSLAKKPRSQEVKNISHSKTY